VGLLHVARESVSIGRKIDVPTSWHLSLSSPETELVLEICAGIDVIRRKKKIVKIKTATSDEIIAYSQILEIKYKQAAKLTAN